MEKTYCMPPTARPATIIPARKKRSTGTWTTVHVIVVIVAASVSGVIGAIVGALCLKRRMRNKTTSDKVNDGSQAALLTDADQTSNSSYDNLASGQDIRLQHEPRLAIDGIQNDVDRTVNDRQNRSMFFPDCVTGDMPPLDVSERHADIQDRRAPSGESPQSGSGSYSFRSDPHSSSATDSGIMPTQVTSAGRDTLIDPTLT